LIGWYIQQRHKQRSYTTSTVVQQSQQDLLRLDVADDTLGELGGRGSILDGVGQVRSRNDKGTVAHGIQQIAVYLGTARVNVSERASLEGVAKSDSSL
jgi:hypothetical protein